jgi:hypothetical protein
VLGAEDVVAGVEGNAGVGPGLAEDVLDFGALAVVSLVVAEGGGRTVCRFFAGSLVSWPRSFWRLRRQLAISWIGGLPTPSRPLEALAFLYMRFMCWRMPLSFLWS